MMVDEALWEECRELVAAMPGERPFLFGEILEPPCRVWLVDGDEILVKHDMDFHDANNYLEEPKYVDKGTIVLDDRVLPKEWAFNLYHEAHEVRDMRGGMSYEAAHKRANAGERVLRARALEKDGYV